MHFALKTKYLWHCLFLNHKSTDTASLFQNQSSTIPHLWKQKYKIIYISGFNSMKIIIYNNLYFLRYHHNYKAAITACHSSNHYLSIANLTLILSEINQVCCWWSFVYLLMTLAVGFCSQYQFLPQFSKMFKLKNNRVCVNLGQFSLNTLIMLNNRLF